MYHDDPNAVKRVLVLWNIGIYDLADVGMMALAHNRDFSQRSEGIFLVVENMVHIFDGHPT